MIAFVTLLLGLISGVYPIEVKVGGPVAAVELSLDGVAAGRIEAPPWVARVDLGTGLKPHELVAHALDSEGHELSHVTQWINLPRPPAEVEVVLENDGKGVPRSAQLTWQSVSGVAPMSIALTLDGEPLTVDKTGKAALPARDLGSLHVLSADLWFPPGVTARRDVAYGGQYGSEVSTDLTAVPVRVHPGTTLPAPPALAGWFSLNHQPLTVAAVEDGPAKILLVRVPSGKEVLDKLIAPVRRPTVPVLKAKMQIDDGDRVRFLSLGSSPYKSSKVPAELFDMTRELTAKDGGMFWYLTSTRLLKEPKGKGRRIADAVAVAGLQAAAENDRRAVILVLGENDPDVSRYDVATVRRYLESIRVPLFVWSLYGPDTPGARAWSAEAEDISTLDRLERAVVRLKADLAGQRIVWLDGRHLPQSITLGEEAKGIELVAAAPSP